MSLKASPKTCFYSTEYSQACIVLFKIFWKLVFLIIRWSVFSVNHFCSWSPLLVFTFDFYFSFSFLISTSAFYFSSPFFTWDFHFWFIFLISILANVRCAILFISHFSYYSIHNFLLRQHTYSMKKQKHLPDFTRLCKPEQNTIQNILSLMIFFFFTGSVCGYVWEVLIFLVKEGTFRNRGFLYGPRLPVYGIGAVLFSVILSPRELLPDSSGKYKKNHPVTNVIKLRILT